MQTVVMTIFPSRFRPSGTHFFASDSVERALNL